MFSIYNTTKIDQTINNNSLLYHLEGLIALFKFIKEAYCPKMYFQAP